MNYSARKITFNTNFTIMPDQANYMTPMVFGGAFYSQMDLCAAMCVNEALIGSKCEAAVTHKSEVTYMSPTYIGDCIFLEAEVLGVHKKSIKVWVNAFRQRRGSKFRDKVAFGEFIFVSIEHTKDVADRPDKLPYSEHGIKL